MKPFVIRIVEELLTWDRDEWETLPFKKKKERDKIRKRYAKYVNRPE